MGRAYEVRKASIQKTGAIKAKTYSLFAKEIYEAAKNGIPEIDSNITLKRIVDKAKKNQVPADIIDRAIEKAKGAGIDSYETIIYEGFGPGTSTLMIKCLTDNVNRTISLIRAAFNKAKSKLGVPNCVSYNYSNIGIISFKYDNDEEVLELLLNDGIDIVDFETDNKEIIISCHPQDFHKVKDTLEKNIKNIEYNFDEIGWYPNEKVSLTSEELEVFNRLYDMLDDIEDVANIYHNVNL